MRLKPPPGPMVDVRTGEPVLAWLDYLQRLADRIAELEARVVTLATAPPPTP